RTLIDGDLQIEVSDDGIGIPRDKISHALEPFGQIHDASVVSRDNVPGTGLGLPLAKAMVELHGGTLMLKSDIGKGTTVLITFPRTRAVN
ncbi:MAG: ATP-binding protein, partial [Alphaproteobacteria bacterium]|nr:ATP-binding protein [Alphaproteobacteria bacterium]